jgi:hypothetical protein
MSDNDTTEESNVSEETVEFAQSHFDEDAVDTTATTATDDDSPAEPAEDNAETTETDADKAEESTEDKPAESEDKPDEAITEEKSESDLKGMTRAERAVYFQSLKQEQTREVAEVVNQNYQPQDVTDLQQAYLDAGYSDGEALMLARQDVAEQKAQIAEATTEIAELNANLRVDSFEAQATYDWMNPAKADTYDKESHEAAAQIFSQGITTDPRTGQIIEARMSPKQAADIVDKIRNSGTAKAQLAAQKAAEAQLAAVAPPTSSAPPSSSQSADDKQASGLERAMNIAV